MKAETVRASLVLCASLCTTAPIGGQAPMGALAMDERQGDRYGWAVHQRTPAAAGEEAVRECGPGCSAVLTFERTAVSMAAAATGQQAPAGQPGAPAVSAEPTEALFWQSIMNSENPADFEAYLAQFPNGVFRALAENRLSALRPATRGAAVNAEPAAASAELEDWFWQSIADSAIPADFAAYLAQFPNGAFRRLAENRLSALRSPPRAPAGGAGRPSSLAGSAVSGSLVSGTRVSGAAVLAVESAADSGLHPGDVFRDCEACPEMVVIPAGRFLMGCVSGLDCLRRELPVHEVDMTSFALGRYEVTFPEYERFVAATSRRRPDDRGMGGVGRPVNNVTWEDAANYAVWLSQETGARYRLASEAEWEYAARAGTATRYSWGQDVGLNRANCDGCGRWTRAATPAPVGSFAANAWGLYDMHGNVWEWVEDCWHENYRSAPRDGTAWTRGGDCGRRSVRGGSWTYTPPSVRSSSRTGTGVDRRNPNVGFRVAMTLD